LSYTSNVKYLAGGSYQQIQAASELKGQAKKIVKGFTEIEIAETLESAEKTMEFAKGIYAKLTASLQLKIKREDFISSILMNREKALKRKKNSKKLKSFLFK